jgi:PAS domain S-box-containing protein
MPLLTFPPLANDPRTRLPARPTLLWTGVALSVCLFAIALPPDPERGYRWWIPAGALVAFAAGRFWSAAQRRPGAEEETLREVIEQAGDAIFVHDLDGRFRLVNRQACVSLGYERGELLALRPWDFVPHPRDDLLAFYSQLAPGAPWTFETNLRRKDGSEFPVEGRVVRYTHRGRPTIVGVLRDVSEGKRAEAARAAGEALRVSEERNRAILGALNEGVLLLNAEGRLLLANASAERILGLDADALRATKGQTSFDVFHEDGAPWPREETPTAKALATGEPQVDVVAGVRRRADGAFFWVLANAQPLRDSRTGAVWGVTVSFIDVTSRKQAETALRESEERLRGIVRGARLIIWTLDRDGVFTFSDGSGLATLGVQPGEVVGRSVFDVYKHVPEVVEATRRALAGAEVNFVVTVKGIAWDSRYSPLRDATGGFAGVIGVATDVTERLRAEQALVRLRDELEARVADRTADLARANQALQSALAERQRAEQLARGQKVALVRTLQVLAARPAVDDLLGHILAAIAGQVGAELAEFWFYDGATDSAVPHLTGTGATRPGTAGPRLEAVGRTPVGRALFRQHEYVLLTAESDGARSAAFRDWSRDRPGVRILLLAPLVAGDESVGSFSIGRTDSRPFRPEEIELARALAYQATLAIQLTRLAQTARKSAVLEERNRMAREIHDTLAQGFTGIIFQLETARLRADSGAANIAQALDLARQSLQEARRSVWALRPGPLAGGDLADALSRLLAREREKHRETVRLDFTHQGEVVALTPEIEENLLRVVQEALANALTHGRPRSVAVDLTFEPGVVRLSVVDDGVGFDPAAARPGGFGLTSMRERVEHLGGAFALDSAPDEGVTVTATVPLPQPPRHP